MGFFRKAVRQYSLFFAIACLGAGLAGIVHWKYETDLKTARDNYKLEAHDRTSEVSQDIEHTFRMMYQGMRTIALLPGVRSIDRYAAHFDANARRTTQELYNNIASNVAMSEVYIVPLEMQPDEKDTHTGKLQEPITTFDQLIVGHNADQDAAKKEEPGKAELPEIEIYEYRTMRKQLDWFRKNYPREQDIAGLEFPALCSPEVITCDNSHYSPSTPNDKDRSGMVYSVPFYDQAGRLKGCISGVILTHAFRALLPGGNYALQSHVNAFTAAPYQPGTWQTSARWGATSQADPNLISSEVRPLKVQDGNEVWTLWAGLPDTFFWKRSDVQSAKRFALTGYLTAGILCVGLYVISILARRYRAEIEAKNDELEVANAQLQTLATTDGMTGLANHRTFQEKLREAAIHAAEAKSPLALLLMDVDKFKQYNDTFGHPAGDLVLKTLGKLLHDSVHSTDLAARCIARYGGEEFAVILTEEAAEQAGGVAERIRAQVEAHTFEHRAVTLSIGVAVYDEDVKGAEFLVTRADQALYTAKHQGRNRVVFAGEMLLPLVNSAVAEDTGFLTRLFAEPLGQVVTGLMLALEARDAETEGHCERVVRYALRLAQELEPVGYAPLTPELRRELALGALLHDIGKMSIPDGILLKPGALTVEEWDVMRTHPARGVAMLQSLPQLAHALPLIRSHHERWDGAGYPDKLAGEAIPLTARLFAIVDTFDAMVSERPYRAPLPYSVIYEEITAQSGKQFDPALVEAFRRISEEAWREMQDAEIFRTALHLPNHAPLSKAA